MASYIKRFTGFKTFSHRNCGLSLKFWKEKNFVRNSTKFFRFIKLTPKSGKFSGFLAYIVENRNRTQFAIHFFNSQWRKLAKSRFLTIWHNFLWFFWQPCLMKFLTSLEKNLNVKSVLLRPKLHEFLNFTKFHLPKCNLVEIKHRFLWKIQSFEGTIFSL